MLRGLVGVVMRSWLEGEEVMLPCTRTAVGTYPDFVSGEWLARDGISWLWRPARQDRLVIYGRMCS